MIKKEQLDNLLEELVKAAEMVMDESVQKNIFPDDFKDFAESMCLTLSVGYARLREDENTKPNK